MYINHTKESRTAPRRGRGTGAHLLPTPEPKRAPQQSRPQTPALLELLRRNLASSCKNLKKDGQIVDADAGTPSGRQTSDAGKLALWGC